MHVYDEAEPTPKRDKLKEPRLASRRMRAAFVLASSRARGQPSQALRASDRTVGSSKGDDRAGRTARIAICVTCRLRVSRVSLSGTMCVDYRPEIEAHRRFAWRSRYRCACKCSRAAAAAAPPSASVRRRAQSRRAGAFIAVLALPTAGRSPLAEPVLRCELAATAGLPRLAPALSTPDLAERALVIVADALALDGPLHPRPVRVTGLRARFARLQARHTSQARPLDRRVSPSRPQHGRLCSLTTTALDASTLLQSRPRASTA